MPVKSSSSNGKGSSSSSSSSTHLFGFGPNYYHNMGGATRQQLPHQLYSEAADGGNNTTDDSGDDADDYKRISNNNSNSSPEMVDVYTFEDSTSAAAPWQSDKESITEMACGAASTVFLTDTGKVYTSGTIHGRTTPSPTLTTIPLPLKCVQVAAGRHFCLGKMEGGLAVVSWGAGHFGQLGLGDAQPMVEKPTVIDGLLPHVTGTPVASISAGYWHAMAVNEAGQVWAWGCNRNHQCGRKRPGDAANPSESTTNTPPPTLLVPQPVPNLQKIRKIAAGRAHSMALDSKGAVYCWGSSSYGQCSGTITSKRKCGIAPPKQVEALQKVTIVDIAAGETHSLALTGGGRVFSWGSSVEGQLGLGVCLQANPKPKLIGDLDFVAIEASRDWRREGREISRTANDNDLVVGSPLTSSRHSSSLATVPKIVKVQARANYSVGTSSSGHIYVWGCNDAGTLGVPKPQDKENLTVLDPVNPVLPPLIKPAPPLRTMDFQTFDSAHNLGLPKRVDCVSQYRIASCALGPTHLWCLGHDRDAGTAAATASSYKDQVGFTLHELQEKRNERKSNGKRSSPSRRYKKGTSSTDDDEGDNVSDDTDGQTAKRLSTIEDSAVTPPEANVLGSLNNNTKRNSSHHRSSLIRKESAQQSGDTESSEHGDNSQSFHQDDAALAYAAGSGLSLTSPGGSSKGKKFRPMKLIKKLSNRRGGATTSSTDAAPLSPGTDMSGELTPANGTDKKLRRFFS